MSEKKLSKIDELIASRLKKKTQKQTTELKEISTLLKKFEEGYTKRDISNVLNWVKELMATDVQIIGTNSVFPEDFEWRSGHEAAFEMFENDWKNWGDVRFYMDEAEISVEKDAAWVAIFAIVTVDSNKKTNRAFEASKKRSLTRIKNYCEDDLPSTRVLYEIINDAIMVLSQYERDKIFVWPIRVTLALMKIENIWKIKQIHFSWPGRGFPSVRLLNE